MEIVDFLKAPERFVKAPFRVSVLFCFWGANVAVRSIYNQQYGS